MIYFIRCKNLCKYSNVYPPSTTVIKKNQNKENHNSMHTAKVVTHILPPTANTEFCTIQTSGSQPYDHFISH
jgi:hypothetical protein